MKILPDDAFDLIGAIFEWLLRLGVAALVFLIALYLSVLFS